MLRGRGDAELDAAVLRARRGGDALHERARLAEALGWKRIPKLRFVSLGVLAEGGE